MIYSPRGVEDILPSKTPLYQWVEKQAGGLFRLYGFEEIRTPIFEKTELFLRTVGQETDVGKQMYTFKDKRGRSLSLRPEATASIVRAYLEHKLNSKRGEWRVYYMGPMFRYERPQAHRLREFRQIGVEVIGQESPWLDVEIIEMVFQLLKKLGIASFDLRLNYLGCRKCRKCYVEELKQYFSDKVQYLCSVCQGRYQTNLLRILDCKKTQCRQVTEKAPEIITYLCPDCQQKFSCLQEGLTFMKIPFMLDHQLVRGLDYYTRTIFEITSTQLGAQDAICGGGRYDDLVEELGGLSTPAIGFSLGVERLLAALNDLDIERQMRVQPLLYLATVGEEAKKVGIRLVTLGRSLGMRVSLNLYSKGLSWQLKSAHRAGASWVVIIGEDEIRRSEYILRDMHSGEQKQVTESELERIMRDLGQERKVNN